MTGVSFSICDSGNIVSLKLLRHPFDVNNMIRTYSLKVSFSILNSRWLCYCRVTCTFIHCSSKIVAVPLSTFIGILHFKRAS